VSAVVKLPDDTVTALPLSVRPAMDELSLIDPVMVTVDPVNDALSAWDSIDTTGATVSSENTCVTIDPVALMSFCPTIETV